MFEIPAVTSQAQFYRDKLRQIKTASLLLSRFFRVCSIYINKFGLSFNNYDTIGVSAPFAVTVETFVKKLTLLIYLKLEIDLSIDFQEGKLHSKCFCE